MRPIRNRAVVIVVLLRRHRQRARPLKRPRDDIQPELLRRLGVEGRDVLALLVQGHEIRQRGSDDAHARIPVERQVRRRLIDRARGVTALVEEYGLPAERRRVLEPVRDVPEHEALQPDARRMNPGLDVFVDDLLLVLLRRVVALEGHGHARLLQLGREHEAPRVDEADELLVREHRRARRVQVRPPAGRTVQVVLGRGGGRVEPVHLAAQRLELGEGDVARAARRRRRLAAACGLEGFRALGTERGGDDVRRRIFKARKSVIAFSMSSVHDSGSGKNHSHSTLRSNR